MQKHKWKWKSLSRVRLFSTPWTIQSLEFSRPEYWSGYSLSLLQGIFPTQGSNPGLPYCGQILYQLSHQGSPRILEWVAYPFSSESSQPRNWTGVSCMAGRFFTNWAIREARIYFGICLSISRKKKKTFCYSNRNCIDYFISYWSTWEELPS